MQKFCHNCGKQLVAGAKFCPFCGTSLSSLSATSPASTPATPANATSPGFTPFAVASDDDDDESSSVDKLTRAPIRQTELHVDIVRDRPMGETIGSALASPINPEALKNMEQRPSLSMSADEFKKDFQREAGTKRHEAAEA